MARPTKLTAEVQDRICKAISAGNYVETAAAFAGISKSTLYDWLRRGARASRGIYHDFSLAVEMALAEAEVADIATIENAARAQWQAAAWRLERKYPSRWGRKERHEITGPESGPLRVKVERVDMDNAEAEGDERGV